MAFVVFGGLCEEQKQSRKKDTTESTKDSSASSIFIDCHKLQSDSHNGKMLYDFYNSLFKMPKSSRAFPIIPLLFCQDFLYGFYLSNNDFICKNLII